MLRKLSAFVIALLITMVAHAQPDSSHLRISLITCGVGDEIWETFGHTGVRVIDSVRGTDIVYNYGTFNGYDKDFEIKFMRGRLLYFVSTDHFNDFMQEYIEAHRKVEEQVLQLTGEQKQDIYNYLEWNTLPANMYYKYDFYFDNCATRIRDIFPNTIKGDFKFGQTIPHGKRISYRNITDQYLYQKHWERLGIDILLGSTVDKPMTNEGAMFLPDYLRDGVKGATVNGKRISTDPVTILPGSYSASAGINQPFILMCVIAIITIAGLYFPNLKLLGNVMSSLIILITGLLGVLILFMWFGTDHKACQDNFNLLWALPTNIILAFRSRGRSKYALVAIFLLLISLVLHVLKIQELPLLELSPLLLTMLFIYGTIYRRGKTKAA
ncbi:MAG: Lnb N-terminal periplasmic domain-containing protein [Flavipsychrobacter sp.]